MTAGRCQVCEPFTGAACIRTATQLVYFIDATTARACGPCAVRLRELARTLGTTLRVEDLAGGSA